MLIDFEKNYPAPLCGVDEVGRGPWAGAVVAAAVILNPLHIPAGINDSKKLSAKKREIICAELKKHAQWAIGIASVEEIDQLNILQASLLAMRRAVLALPSPPAFALVDGNRAPDLPCPCETIIKGDSISISIAAASIIAKVTRDNMLTELAREYPQYGFEKHAGYGTKQHQLALAEHGITPEHRRSFAPIKALL